MMSLRRQATQDKSEIGLERVRKYLVTFQGIISLNLFFCCFFFFNKIRIFLKLCFHSAGFKIIIIKQTSLCKEGPILRPFLHITLTNIFLLNSLDVSSLIVNQIMTYLQIKMHLLNINNSLDYLTIYKIGGRSWTLVINLLTSPRVPNTQLCKFCYKDILFSIFSMSLSRGS